MLVQLPTASQPRMMMLLRSANLASRSEKRMRRKMVIRRTLLFPTHRYFLVRSYRFTENGIENMPLMS